MKQDTKSTRERDLWVVNGLASNGLWRVDCVRADADGISMLANPIALCPRREMAQQIADEHNACGRIVQLWSAWCDGDEPEGAPSARRALEQIGELMRGVSDG